MTAIRLSPAVPLPLYDQTYNGVNVNSNGRLDFVTRQRTRRLHQQLSPSDSRMSGHMTYTAFPLWTDQCTDNTPSACGGDNCTGCGIFTSVEGSQVAVSSTSSGARSYMLAVEPPRT